MSLNPFADLVDRFNVLSRRVRELEQASRSPLSALGVSVMGAKVSSHAVEFVRIGPLVTFAGTITADDTWVTNEHVLDIPDGFFPKPSYQEVVVVNSGTTLPCILRFSPTIGTVTFRDGAVDGGDVLRIHGSYASNP